MPVIIGGVRYLSIVDSAFPLRLYPITDGVAFYVGGDTPHIWSPSEINATPARYRLPIFVRDNPGQASPDADVAECVARLEIIGCPPGRLIDWDSETSEDPAYISTVSWLLGAAGFRLIDYGSRNYVSGNRNPDGWYWDANWTFQAHVDPGDEITQYGDYGPYDLSLAREDILPWLWDAHPPAASWTYPAPGHLEAYQATRSGYQVRWDAVRGPANQVPSTYTVATYAMNGEMVGHQLTAQLWASEYGTGGKGLPQGTYQTHVWANGAPLGPPHASVIVTLAG